MDERCKFCNAPLVAGACTRVPCQIAWGLARDAELRPRSEVWQQVAREAAKLAREARAEEDTDGKA